MIHSGSRGLGHQVATDALVQMETAMARDGIKTNDRQLACAKINSKVQTSNFNALTTIKRRIFVVARAYHGPRAFLSEDFEEDVVSASTGACGATT